MAEQVDAQRQAAHVAFTRFSPAEGEELADVLTEERWPYHGGPAPDRATILSRVRDNVYDGDTTMTFWVVRDDVREGFVRIFDLNDATAMFDVRLRERARGRGLGTLTVKWLVDHVFESVMSVSRIEATTRDDNRPMRRALLASGFVKEAHYRRGWPTEDGERDAVGYAILRTDWESEETTPVNWSDEPSVPRRQIRGGGDVTR